MLPEADDAAIQADVYIEALLTGHARLPVLVTDDVLASTPKLRDAIRLLERGLPRFHPSFFFEEWLADQLRAASRGATAPGRLIRLDPSAEPALDARSDRRLLLGGAIASGVSIAGAAAMLAWRRSRRRQWLT